MTVKELIPAFEAVLFSAGEPLGIERFSQVFEIEPETVTEIMAKLAEICTSLQPKKNTQNI